MVECAYTRSCLMPELKYFGAPLELGPRGIQKHLGVPELANQECAALYEALPEIKRAICLGEVSQTQTLNGRSRYYLLLARSFNDERAEPRQSARFACL